MTAGTVALVGAGGDKCGGRRQEEEIKTKTDRGLI